MASTEFKTAIKKSEREIKGYCLIDYTNDENIVNRDINSSSTEAVISEKSQLKTTNGITYNYASFENKYFKTDGSMVLANDPTSYDNPLAGYISQDTTVSNKSIYIETYNENLNKGISLYFDDNYPIDYTFSVTYSDPITTNHEVIDYEFTNEDKSTILFDTYYRYSAYPGYNIYSVEFIGTKFFNSEHRMRLKGLNCGIIGNYSDNDLLNININEETDITNQTTPISDCSLTLNNYDGKFDILNNTGLSYYLKNGIPIKSYIGVVVGDGYVEYEPMGIYYLVNWNNNDDKTTTINGQNYLTFFSNKKSGFREGGNPSYQYQSDYFEALMQNLGVSNYNITSYNENEISDNFLKGCYASEQINMMNIVTQPRFYVERDGVITLADNDITVSDTFSLNEFKTYPKITINKKIHKVIISKPSGNGIEDVEGIIYQSNIIHDISGITKVYIEFDYPINFATTITPFVVSSGTITKQYHNNYVVYLEVTTTSDFTLTITSYKANSPTYETFTYVNDLVKDGDTIELTLQGSYPQEATYVIAQNLFLTDYNYTINCDSIGDPSIKAGDLISVETSSGYKDIYVNKLGFKYDGGLSCEIEGVGN